MSAADDQALLILRAKEARQFLDELASSVPIAEICRALQGICAERARDYAVCWADIGQAKRYELATDAFERLTAKLELLSI
jgi:hypothetical protein